MNELIPLLIIALIASFVTRKSKKVAQKRPGSAPPPRPNVQAPGEARQVVVKEATPKASMPTPEVLKKVSPSPSKPQNKKSGGMNLPPEIRRVLDLEDPEPPRTPAHTYKPKEGQSRKDASGCIGGSLPHTHTESPAPVPAAVAVKAASPSLSTYGAVPEKEVLSGPLPSLSSEEMRRAVVLSEILARPVALRPRGYRL